eukprot:CAMPEP_0172595990 /NCGR_PEP_ID=MMETSP1068-20121228/15683_1 /TAXON_ID=35684 /ORGANISM="Pseudopedinella elastica, Strain CCMP716" /LENGTH=558 /DNA_ID=CAMNT_0013394805 /DNA_START=494 /DNA_END=2170 /DNA_ORIENTATION=+
MADWLNNFLGMPIATQSQFYACIFMPYWLKPLYAFVANAVGSNNGLFQRRSRAIVLHVCGLMSALLYVATLGVKTIPGAFGIFFCINIFDSCSELMLGSYLMGIAHQNIKDAGALQALAGGMRALGAFSASLIALAMYPCDPSRGVPDSRLVLACSGSIASLTCFLALLLPDTEHEPLITSPQDNPLPSSLPSELTLPLMPEKEGDNSRISPSTERGPKDATSSLWTQQFKSGMRVAALVLIFQVVLVWISLKDMIKSGAFKQVFYPILGLLSAIMLAVSSPLTSLCAGLDAASSRRLLMQYVAPGAFLFLAGALPSASEQLYTYQFYLFYARHPCRMTLLGLIGSASSVVGFALYGSLCNLGHLQYVIVATSTISASLGLLWLPLASLTLEDADDPIDRSACIVTLNGKCALPPFAFACIMSFLTGMGGALASAALTTLATNATPRAHKTTAYAIFLSLMDSGDSVSGWISASLVQRLGIDYGHWAKLPELIWIAAASQLALLLFVPCLRDDPNGDQGEEKEKARGVEPQTPGAGQLTVGELAGDSGGFVLEETPVF